MSDIQLSSNEYDPLLNDVEGSINVLEERDLARLALRVPAAGVTCIFYS